jgi:serine/threonine-protein kinase
VPPAQNDSPRRKRLPPGTIIAERYRVGDVLGEGSMGTVYAVEHLLLKKKMALKVLHADLTSVKNVAARFEREAMATAKIDHPNAAAAVDFGRLEDGSLYFAMELVEGRSLRSELQSGALPFLRALHVARQIASLLSATQPLGIVHRDLKPENVLLVQRGDDPDFVKVLDFGIARMTGPDPGTESTPEALTKLGAVFGTPEYMAPEQALGQHVDTRADLYSLGIILFEMIAGVHPFKQPGTSGILAQQITMPRPSFADAAPLVSVPEGVERVVSRLLAKGVAERYQRASDVAQALEELEANPRSVARGSSEALPSFELNTHLTGLPNASSLAAEIQARAAHQEQEPVTAVPEAQRKAPLAAVRRHLGPALSVLDRGTRRLTSNVRAWLATLPRVAIVTFCSGLGVGLLVALVTWLTLHKSKGVADSASSVVIGALPRGSADSVPLASSVAETPSAEPSMQANPNDPELLVVQAQSKVQQGKDSEAIALLAKAIGKHPDRRNDTRVADALYRLANSSAKDAADSAFSVLEGTMAAKGAEILYRLWLDKAVRDTTRRRAEKWLRSEQFHRSAPNALVIAVQLRAAETCDKKHALLTNAKTGGSIAALTYLKELRTEKGCGLDGQTDCWPCLRKDGALEAAISAIESRSPSP